MGVNGLWTVVQPCARPTNLATLNRKRLAVDASIWIYQFLKAVRDKEGNALRNSHVVGFFRRICKLLWFGIQPVFVFDGGAPALKRATIQKRQRRREGRRDDAVRTAGKLLAVHMQRVAEEAERTRKRAEPAVAEEPMPDPKDMVYLDEVGMSNHERQRNRKFHKTDAYHLPELEGGIASMGKPDDPRIMSVEELEEYARQFNSGEDINLYDFSKIDFDGEFFKSLPPPDRYNILNAARLRSRLRMGLSKDQLDDMFPDRMAFSRFQIERVKERNHLTQRLMHEVGMTGLDLTLGVNARVAGEKDREYILVKNEGAEGGWALGVVSKEKDIGEAHKPIDIDAIAVQYQTKEEEEDEDDEGAGFEDVPIEGLNRLPKYDPTPASLDAARDLASKRQQFYESHRQTSNDEEESLFVGGSGEVPAIENENEEIEHIHPEEEDDLNRAIALSLQNQHGVREESVTEDDLFEDVPVGDKPEWTQKAVEAAKPLTAHSGSMIAHIVNNRSNAAVPKRPEKPETQDGDKDSDSDEDMQAIMARSLKANKQAVLATRPILENKKNPFDGPLPFPKLSWGSSLFGKSKAVDAPAETAAPDPGSTDSVADEAGDQDDMAGGFTVEDDQEPELPPWLADESDIRDSLKKQQAAEREINKQDREEAEEAERRRRKEMQGRLIEIESEPDSDSDIQIIEVPPSPAPRPVSEEPHTASRQAGPEQPELDAHGAAPSTQLQSTMAESLSSEAAGPVNDTLATIPQEDAESPEPEFEDIELPQVAEETAASEPEAPVAATSHTQERNAGEIDDDELFNGAEEHEYSDPEEEELLVQMAEEAEEHARFASELNQKSMEQNRRDYETELRQLRTQQKKDRRDADEVTQVMISECQSLLRLFGIPYITAPMEAEAQCAELVRLGMVDGIVTDDSDTFLFGGTRVYKNMFNSNKFVECYLGSELEKDLSLSRQQLISLAHLLGSDYTEGLPGVGPVTAVEIISEFPGEDGLGDFRSWWETVQSQPKPTTAADAGSAFRKKFRRSQAAKLFLPPGFPNRAVDEAYLRPEVDSSTEPFRWGVPDVEGLRRFLMATIGWSKERTDEVLVPVIRDMNKREAEGTQSNITRFFGGAVGAGAREEAFAPRKTAGASKRMAAAVDRLKQNTAGEERGRGAESTSKRQKR